MDITAHALITLINGYKAEVLVNDVPLVRTAADRYQQNMVHATPWTVDGVNELRLVIEGSLLPAPQSSGSPLPEPTPEPDTPWRASARLVEGFLGQIPTPEESTQLASINWSPPPGGGVSFPASLSQSFSLAGRPRWAWQDARLVELGIPSERARVLSFVREIHGHFAAKRIGAILDCMKSRLAEAPHFGATPGEVRASFERDFWTLASLPDYEVEPYNEADIHLRAVARGKVILVQRKDGSAFLQSKAGASKRGAFRLFLASLSNGLEIVRTA